MSSPAYTIQYNTIQYNIHMLNISKLLLFDSDRQKKIRSF